MPVRGGAYTTLSTASLEQACIDHFTDTIGAALAKNIICSKPSKLDKALSEALELEALELRAVRMREKVVSKGSTLNEEASWEQTPSLPGCSPLVTPEVLLLLVWTMASSEGLI